MEVERTRNRDGERGMIVILMAVAIVALIGAGSLAVDIGSALVTKSELQNVSDAAALAGTRKLADTYQQHPDWIMQDINGNLTAVKTKAQEYAEFNKAGGVAINVPDEDLLFGTYDPATGNITETTNKVRVVQVTSRREGATNGSLPTQLATVLGINDIAVRATTAAALTPIRKLHGGEGDFPIGISREWFNSHVCGDDDIIVLFPTSPTSCAGWHTFTNTPASASKLGTIVDGLRTGTFSSPETIAGETSYIFTGGTVESKCSNLKDLFDAKKVNGKMTAHIPVYDFDCGNVSGPNVILGFVEAEIQQVVCGSSNRKLDVKVKCGVVDGTVGEGGGAKDYGLLSMSPSMIQ